MSEAQYRVSSALATATSLDEAAERTMAAIGDALHWNLGFLWLVDETTGVLRAARVWQAHGLPGEAPHSFASRSLDMTFRPGEGLPGYVLAEGQPAWIEQVENFAVFTRQTEALAAGLTSALAFPLQSDGEILGVMEFFHTEIQPPNEEMLRMLEGVGHQIGQFLVRRQVEEAALRTGALQSAMLASALDCIVSMDHTGSIVEWNAEAERTFGYSREEALGSELASLIIPPALRDRHRAGLAHYLATGEGPVIGSRLEIMAVRRDGTEFPVELAISRIAGEPACFTGFIRDITERKQSEKEQQWLANYNHLLLQSTGEGIYGVDTGGQLHLS